MTIYCGHILVNFANNSLFFSSLSLHSITNPLYKTTISLLSSPLDTHTVAECCEEGFRLFVNVRIVKLETICQVNLKTHYREITLWTYMMPLITTDVRDKRI